MALWCYRMTQSTVIIKKDTVSGIDAEIYRQTARSRGVRAPPRHGSRYKPAPRRWAWGLQYCPSQWARIGQSRFVHGRCLTNARTPRFLSDWLALKTLAPTRRPTQSGGCCRTLSRISLLTEGLIYFVVLRIGLNITEPFGVIQFSVVSSQSSVLSEDQQETGWIHQQSKG